MKVINGVYHGWPSCVSITPAKKEHQKLKQMKQLERVESFSLLNFMKIKSSN
jgi:hypothetical protein